MPASQARPTFGRLVIIAVAGTILLFSLWFIWRAAAIKLLSATDPSLVIRFRPVSERALLARMAGGVTDAREVEAINAAAAAAPVSGGPFLAAARYTVTGGTGAPAARALLLAAKERSPRSIAVRLALLDNFTRGQLWNEALDEADAAMRLDNGVAQKLAPVIATLAPTATARQHLVGLLSRAPSWRDYFLKSKSEGGAHLATTFESLQGRALDNAGREDESSQSAFINDLIRKKKYDLAYLAFVNFLPPEVLGKVHAIYDGNFEDLPGAPPFNWTFFQRGGENADFTKDGPGLVADSIGDAKALIASQSLILAPGTLTLTVQATSNDAMPANSFVWELKCFGNSAPLARLDISGTGQLTRTVKFTVPEAGCEMQNVELVANPLESPARHTIRIVSIDVAQVNSDASS